MGEFASKGVAGTALGLGIAGTVGLVNQLGNGGILGGILGGNCGGMQAELAQIKAERYADQIGIGAYKQSVADDKAFSDRLFDKYIEPISKEIADMRVREARMEERLHCMHKEFQSAIALESERRTSGDQNLMCYVNATFVPGKLVMPKDSICPTVMPEYNSWTAPTTSTT